MDLLAVFLFQLIYGIPYWGVLNTAKPQKKLTNTALSQKNSPNTAIPQDVQNLVKNQWNNEIVALHNLKITGKY